MRNQIQNFLEQFGLTWTNHWIDLEKNKNINSIYWILSSTQKHTNSVHWIGIFQKRTINSVYWIGWWKKGQPIQWTEFQMHFFNKPIQCTELVLQKGHFGIQCTELVCFSWIFFHPDPMIFFFGPSYSSGSGPRSTIAASLHAWVRGCMSLKTFHLFIWELSYISFCRFCSSEGPLMAG